MAAKRRPERDQAFEIWRDSNKMTHLKEIAELLGVAKTLIRKWKCQDKWDEKMNGNVTNGNGNVTNENDKSNGNVTIQQNSNKRRGPPLGSKNAKGHGAPKGNKNGIGNRGGPGGMPGNKNAVTTGEYETIWFDCLTEEEQLLYDKIDTSTLAQVEAGIKFFTFRERRMMERIHSLMAGLSEKERKVLQELQIQKKPMEVYSEKDGTSKVLMIPEANMVVTEITETEYRTIDDILKVEEALTRVQDKKTRAIALKHSIEVTRSIELEKLNLSKARLLFDIEKAKGESKGNQHVDALRQKMQERKMKHGSS